MARSATFAQPATRPRRVTRLLLLRAAGALTGPLTPSEPLPHCPARILVVRPDHLGDGLFATPALRALREAFPAARISALVGPWAMPVYGRLTSLDRVITCPFPGFGPVKAHPLAPYALLLRQAATLGGEGYDLVINLRFDFWWGAMLGQAARVRARLGYDWPECRPFLTRGLAYAHGRHEVAQNLALVGEVVESDPGRRAAWLSRALGQSRLEFPLSAAEMQTGERLHGTPAEARAVVAIHPGTRGAAKLWHAEGWAAVADALVARWGFAVALTGSETERPLCEAVRERMRGPAQVLAGTTKFGELGAFFARCTLVLGVDSGPLHLAVALGRPTVHLFGPSDPLAFGPFGNPERQVVVRAGVECSPCHRFDWPVEAMPEHDCMRAITPGNVLSAVEQALAAERQ